MLLFKVFLNQFPQPAPGHASISPARSPGPCTLIFVMELQITFSAVCFAAMILRALTPFSQSESISMLRFIRETPELEVYLAAIEEGRVREVFDESFHPVVNVA